MTEHSRETHRLCFECGKRLRLERDTVHYEESGLNNVWLANVPVWRCANGHEELEIPAVDELHDLLADVIIRKAVPLVGQEVRFLRKRLEFTAQQFAVRIGVTPVHLSRLENGRRALQRQMDLLVRLYCAHLLAQKRQQPCPAELTSILAQLESGVASVSEHRFRHRRSSKKGAVQQEWTASPA